MGVSFDHRDAGTSEQIWREAEAWANAPALDLDVDAVVVLAAHPDDETLGAGGLIAEASHRGIPVSVIVATDGDADHPVASTRRMTRRRESLEAADALAPAASVSFLGFPDGAVREERDAIADAVERMLPRTAGARVLLAAPWWGDGHRDHRVLGEIALAAQRPGIRVVGYPIWMWHWADPRAVDTASWRALALPPSTRAAKERAIDAHRSQLTPPSAQEPPIIHDGMRAHFARDVEIFIDAPADATASVPTAFFDEFFARHDDPWGFDTRWYERRKREVTMAALLRPRYGAALELGCATGRLTSLLAERCDALTAVDASAVALERAAPHSRAPHVRFALARIPDQWPEGSFDLVVVSELLYYLDTDDRAETLRRIAGSLAPGGSVLACHWRHPIDGAPADGDRVHRELLSLGLRRAVSHVEDDMVLEVFVDGAAVSPARAEGLVP